jgi:hypothetical protein
MEKADWVSESSEYDMSYELFYMLPRVVQNKFFFGLTQIKFRVLIEKFNTHRPPKVLGRFAVTAMPDIQLSRIPLLEGILASSHNLIPG